MKSVNAGSRFANVPNVEIPRSTFDRSHGYKTTFDAGYLVPIFLELDVLPGDTIKLDLTGFARLSTPIYPIMDNMVLETFFFFVPYRILWENWKKHQGERTNPGDSIDYTVPQITDLVNADNETLWDYFGLPTKVTAAYEFNAWAPLAYNMIWNEWFRDQNLQDSVYFDTGNGPHASANFELLKRGKRHDYFTSCLPWLQKGDAVLLSLGQTAPVTLDSSTMGDPQYIRDKNAHALSGLANLRSNASGVFEDTNGVDVVLDPNNTLIADLSLAQGPTVNELREAIQIQRLLERDARAGTRYNEILLSHFGVTTPDYRVQKPEYLGGGRTPVNITPIARTDSSPGVLGAMATTAFSNHGFVKSFTEHGLVIGLACVRADMTYQQGLERGWSRQTRYDYYMPTLAHLGEQAVLNKEIYIDATTIGNGVAEEVFGYQERWAEMRYKPSRITGKFRSNDATPLDAWHLGIEFTSQPTLDDDFIQENPPVDRVIAVPTEPHLIYDSYAEMIHTRPMPTYSIPGLIDHF